MRDRLLSLPQEIETFRTQLLVDEEHLNFLQEEMRAFELEQSDEIANAVGEDGKALYSNDAKRRAELERRKKENKQYSEALEAYKLKTLNFKQDKIKLETLYNTQENLRALCRLGGN